MSGTRAGNGGGILCGIYGVMFAGFLWLTIFSPELMGNTEIPVGGDNTLSLYGSDVAVAYGMLLIFGGILVVMIEARNSH